MILVYVDKITNRLGYILNLILKDILGIEYTITTNRENFANHIGAKFSYCKNRVKDEPFIYSTDLLFETTIEIKDLEVFYFEENPAIFRTYAKDSIIPFDVLAASFYFVSRYEEYLPFIQDKHGRYRYEESLAFQNCFLHKPIVNVWVKNLGEKLKGIYPDLEFAKHYFRFYNTIDIDSAYSFKEKGMFRKLYGFAKDFFKGNLSECGYRFNVIFRGKTDPYDNFDYQISLIKKYKLKTIYFILFGRYAAERYAVIPTEEKEDKIEISFLRRRFPEFTEESKKLLQTRNFIHGGSLFKRTCYNAVGGYVKSNIPEDYNFFKRIISAGWNAKKCNDTYLYYRQHSTTQFNIVGEK